MSRQTSTSQPSKVKLFINYRREDSAGHTGRLFDKIKGHFGGAMEIFMDIDSIAPGVDFIQAVEQAVKECDVFVAVIGRYWLNAADKDGQRRLDKADDFVRVEIAAALKRDISVIPVLVHGANMPEQKLLPEVLVKLSGQHAIEITDTRWNYDVERLIKTIEEVINRKKTEAGSLEDNVPPKRRSYFYAAGAVITGVVLLLTGSFLVIYLAFIYFPGQSPNTNVSNRPTVNVNDKPAVNAGDNNSSSAIVGRSGLTLMDVNLRSEPTVGSSPLIVVPKGSTVQITDVKDNFYKVRVLLNGRVTEGWMVGRYIEVQSK